MKAQRFMRKVMHAVPLLVLFVSLCTRGRLLTWLNTIAKKNVNLLIPTAAIYDFPECYSITSGMAQHAQITRSN